MSKITNMDLRNPFLNLVFHSGPLGTYFVEVPR